VISILDLAAMLLTLSALFGWLNRKLLHLPHSVGLLVMGLAASLALVILDVAFPEQHLYEDLTRVLGQVDFTKVVMDGMLAFLLFAGAMSLDLGALRDRAWAVATLALVGTLISTAIVGGAFWLAASSLGQPLSLAWALVFGALISPTDPVAVLATLKNVRVPEALEVEMQGEALFNDGIGIVLFTVLVAFAVGSGGEATTAGGVAKLLLHEAGGGLLLGVVAGYLAYRAMRAIDDASGPLAVVAAGLLVGDRAPRDAMSERTQGYVESLWTLIDEVLNSVLFLLIGLEVLVLRFAASGLLLAVCAVPIVLVARLIAVSAPLLAFRWGGHLSPRNVPFLTWAGVRGGISVALALSLPESEAKSVVLAATYAVVLFTIIVQGLTLGAVARRTLKDLPEGDTT
jgi:monovalent cation:H+ antiporter, CPA1 family